ncbi:unnamed protein product, partial [Porites lobata]
MLRLGIVPLSQVMLCPCRQFWNPAVVGIPVLISGFIMIASLKHFSGKTISLVLIRDLFCLIILPFCLAIRTLATSPARLLLWALMRCPIVCGLLEAAKSSTWRELKAIQFALSAFKASVRGKCVKWYSDSQGAVRVVEIGSPSAELHSIALDIFYFCRTYNITLIPQWVPRELNACADAISHIVDFD